MSNTTSPETQTDMADLCIRLKFVWNTTLSLRESSCGLYNDVEEEIETGCLKHMLRQVSVKHDSATIEASIITQKEEVYEEEIESYQNEVRRALVKHRQTTGNGIGEADTTYIGAIHFSEPDTPTQTDPVRIDTQPVVHCALPHPGIPNKISATTLDTALQDHSQFKGKRIDVQRTQSGFSCYIRDHTVTREQSQVIRGIIIDHEDIIRQKTRLVYTAPNSKTLPESKK